jgi:hypothetical protein
MNEQAKNMMAEAIQIANAFDGKLHDCDHAPSMEIAARLNGELMKAYFKTLETAAAGSESGDMKVNSLVLIDTFVDIAAQMLKKQAPDLKSAQEAFSMLCEMNSQHYFTE